MISTCFKLIVSCALATLAVSSCKRAAPGPQTASARSPYSARSRHAKATPQPSPIPELPANADTLPEITVNISLDHGEVRIVSRSKDRIHLAMPDRNQEWLFIRNPVDGRRVSGILIDHNHKVRIDYPETDLRLEGIARGWADLIAVDQSKGQVTQGVDQKLLQDPATRFPEYGDFEIADWREELHDHGPSEQESTPGANASSKAPQPPHSHPSPTPDPQNAASKDAERAPPPTPKS